jgi:hypothetical protein
VRQEVQHDHQVLIQVHTKGHTSAPEVSGLHRKCHWISTQPMNRQVPATLNHDCNH